MSRGWEGVSPHAMCGVEPVMVVVCVCVCGGGGEMMHGRSSRGVLH